MSRRSSASNQRLISGEKLEAGFAALACNSAQPMNQTLAIMLCAIAACALASCSEMSWQGRKLVERADCDVSRSYPKGNYGWGYQCRNTRELLEQVNAVLKACKLEPMTEQELGRILLEGLLHEDARGNDGHQVERTSLKNAITYGRTFPLHAAFKVEVRYTKLFGLLPPSDGRSPFEMSVCFFHRLPNDGFASGPGLLALDGTRIRPHLKRTWINIAIPFAGRVNDRMLTE